MLRINKTRRAAITRYTIDDDIVFGVDKCVRKNICARIDMPWFLLLRVIYWNDDDNDDDVARAHRDDVVLFSIIYDIF